MKAITLWQPWASLVAIGAKKYETRSWATNYRGPIAIHAAARKPDTKDIPGGTVYRMIETLRPITDKLAKTIMYLPLELLPRGAVIATAELVGCHEVRSVRLATHSAPDECKGDGMCIVTVNDNGKTYDLVTSRDEVLFGDYAPGRFIWDLANVKMLSEPIPARGYQRIWNWGG